MAQTGHPRPWSSGAFCTADPYSMLGPSSNTAGGRTASPVSRCSNGIWLKNAVCRSRQNAPRLIGTALALVLHRFHQLFSAGENMAPSYYALDAQPGRLTATEINDIAAAMRLDTGEPVLLGSVVQLVRLAARRAAVLTVIHADRSRSMMRHARRGGWAALRQVAQPARPATAHPAPAKIRRPARKAG